MSVSGYALITERTAIEVDPINVMVNGEVFQPKNAQGELVDVFAYNGTTYAPLRALAEAYGLEVGYDAEKNLAMVSKPGAASNPAPDGGASALPNFDDWSEEEEAAYQEFKDAWTLKESRPSVLDKHQMEGLDSSTTYLVSCDMKMDAFIEKYNCEKDFPEHYAKRLAIELNGGKVEEKTMVIIIFHFSDQTISREFRDNQIH